MYDLSRDVKVFMIFDMLGDVARTGPQLWHVDRERLESVKDHVFDLGLMLKLLNKYFPNYLDYGKMEDYILFHDLPEVITGDIIKFEGVSEEQKHSVTNIAIDCLEELFDGLFDVRGIIKDYDDRINLEAEIVHMLDKVHSATTFIKYQAGKPINAEDSRIISELRHHPFIEEKKKAGFDVADIFYLIGKYTYYVYFKILFLTNICIYSIILLSGVIRI